MATKEIAIGKRAAIDKASQKMFLAVCAASVVLGLAVVGSIYFIKWMSFNGQVIAQKDEVITNYKTIQKNLESLKVNIMGGNGDTKSGLANNENLEVIARARATGCVSIDGKPVDTENDVELARSCSALRVIPDALPSVLNEPAVLASLNQLFLFTSDGDGNPVEPIAISPSGSGSGATDTVTGLITIPVSLSIKDTSSTARAVLDTIERSIRNFDIRNATIAWRSSDGANRDLIELRGTAVAYHSIPIDIQTETKTKTICADESLCNKKGSSKK